MSAESDDTRVTANTSSQISVRPRPTRQSSAHSTPEAVATPLPPLKPKNSGNKCPRNTVIATSAIPVSVMPKRAAKYFASSTAATPLNVSPNNVKIAAFLLPLLSTLVAPGLPLP